jgi:4-hydroxy-tetrahydrodipicolinate synthase
MQAVLTRFPGFRLFVGSEKFLLQALRLGGVGTITAFANTMPGRLRHFYENWQAPDAEAMQGEVDRWRTIVSAYPVIPALKQIIAAELNDPAWLAVRPPLMSLSPNQSEELMQQLGQSLSNA